MSRNHHRAVRGCPKAWFTGWAAIAQPGPAWYRGLHGRKAPGPPRPRRSHPIGGRDRDPTHSAFRRASHRKPGPRDRRRDRRYGGGRIHRRRPLEGKLRLRGRPGPCPRPPRSRAEGRVHAPQQLRLGKDKLRRGAPDRCAARGHRGTKGCRRGRHRRHRTLARFRREARRRTRRRPRMDLRIARLLFHRC